ncbi:MAG: chromatin remodeling complex ATPase like protein [Caudovirales sp. ctOwN3]|nr:MAG: chromatin remodeling complex ATPase like protein [Caudovirales sp. ctOwN3]
MFKTKPLAHQMDAFAVSKDKKAFALLCEQGTGKSKMAIDKTAYLYGRGQVDAFLIIAPNGVHRNWILNEIPKHMPDYTQSVCAWYASSMKVGERKAFEKLYEPGHFLRVLAINIEAVSTEKGRKVIEKFLRTFNVHMLVDESSKIKHYSTQRTKHLIKLGKLAKFKTISTGTPVTQSPLDIFSQFLFLDEHILHTSSFYAFKARYAELLDESSPILRHIKQRTGGRHTPQIVATDKQGRPLYKNLDELQRFIEPYSFRVLKKDCLDLPEKIYVRRYFDLEAEQKKLYKDIKENLRIEFSDGNFEAMNKLTAVLRLQQVACGLTPVSDEKSAIMAPIFQNPEDNPRIKVLLDIIEELQGKAIIWARFKKDIEQIAKVLEKEYPGSTVLYYGEVDSDTRSEGVKRFQEDPAVRFFIGTQAAGGTGLTLTEASSVIYYSNSFSLEDRLQSEDRAHRIGQKNNVTYYDIEAVDSVDNRIITALRMKKDVASMITKDPIVEWI